MEIEALPLEELPDGSMRLIPAANGSTLGLYRCGGTLYAIVSVVFWVYYAAFILLVGAEVARVHELRRLASLPRRRHGG